MTLYIISQILVFIGIVVDLSGKLCKSKQLLLLLSTIATIFFILSYAFLLSPLPLITNIIFLIRGLLYLYFDHTRKPYWVYASTIAILLALYLPALIIFWNNLCDLLMLISMILILIIFSVKNMTVIRIGIMINCLLWFSYNLSLNAYVNMCSDTLAFIFTVFALIKSHVTPKHHSQIPQLHL